MRLTNRFARRPPRSASENSNAGARRRSRGRPRGRQRPEGAFLAGWRSSGRAGGFVFDRVRREKWNGETQRHKQAGSFPLIRLGNFLSSVSREDPATKIILARGALRGVSIARGSLLSGAASRPRTARPQAPSSHFQLRPRPFSSTSAMTPGAAGGPAAAPRAASAAAITHVLFDMDGLLLDTESAYTDAQRRVLEAIEPGLGAAFTWELKAKMMGRTSLAAGRVLVDALDLRNRFNVDAAEFVRRREEVLATLLPHTRAMPGATRLVEHLRASGVPAAVATSSHRAHFELKSRNHGGLFGNFEHIVTGCAVRCVRRRRMLRVMAGPCSLLSANKRSLLPSSSFFLARHALLCPPPPPTHVPLLLLLLSLKTHEMQQGQAASGDLRARRLEVRPAAPETRKRPRLRGRSDRRRGRARGRHAVRFRARREDAEERGSR